LALYSIPQLRGLSASIFAGSGVLAIIIGFASQQAFANIVGGIFIALFKPFRIGDRIKFVDKEFIGFVEDITLRHTVIRTIDHKRIIVPNSVINSEVIENANIIDEKTIKFFDIGISYDSDVDKAILIIKEEAVKHPLFLDNRSGEDMADNKDPVTVRLIGFGDSSVNLRAYVWAKNPTDAWLIGCDLNKSVKERYDKEGIEIPFPYRTIVYKNSPDKTVT
jgi:small-conductance mechanosensitive channel